MLRRLRRDLGDDIFLAQLSAEQTAAVFTAAWDEAAPRAWNRHRSALRSFTTWAASRGQATTDLAALIERRRFGGWPMSRRPAPTRSCHSTSKTRPASTRIHPPSAPPLPAHPSHRRLLVSPHAHGTVRPREHRDVHEWV
ncbi:hypothetical protein F9B16_11465 [Actinomadura montaniterrae]|uniref:Core-binding (CB) domain-containing protein n=2 Tax=Actinomadura montaniterrae TaxID=1803903 RepID=A0A6L3W1L1_9ACTN|nr:hypothetical protein F9B16_11465 [Actinomadura montaniterrae]